MSCKSGTCNQSILPLDVKYFKEELVCEVLTIPVQKPDIERILDVMVWPEIENVNLIETEKGMSNEGQKLTGIKLVVEVRLKEKVTYVALEKAQSAHAAHYESLKSIFVILPEYVDGRKTCDLVRANRLSVTPYIEDVSARMLDKRTIHKCVMLFIDVKIC
ncbi:MAG: hypothetical protein ACRC68_11535 [Clostridium sp.]